MIQFVGPADSTIEESRPTAHPVLKGPNVKAQAAGAPPQGRAEGLEQVAHNRARRETSRAKRIGRMPPRELGGFTRWRAPGGRMRTLLSTPRLTTVVAKGCGFRPFGESKRSPVCGAGGRRDQLQQGIRPTRQRREHEPLPSRALADRCEATCCALSLAILAPRCGFVSARA